MEALLKSKEVDPNKKDKNGDTPLFWAAKNGSSPLVNLLLKSERINFDAKDKDGRTALSRAVEKCSGCLGQALASNALDIDNHVGKVDPHIKDNSDRTAIFWAAGAKSDASKKNQKYSMSVGWNWHKVKGQGGLDAILVGIEKGGLGASRGNAASHQS